MLQHKIDIWVVFILLGLGVIKIWAIFNVASSAWIWVLFFCLASCIVWSIKHNHLHLPIFNNKILNRIADFGIMIHSGTGVTNTWVIHVINHHPNNNNDKDWTAISNGPGFKNKFIDLIFYPIWIVAVLIKKRKFYKTQIATRRTKRRMREESFVMIAFMLICFWVQPINFLLFFLIPALFSQWFLIASNYLQHDGCDVESTFDHSNNILWKLYNLILFNVGYHTAHHEKPGMHWSLLKKYHFKHLAKRIGEQRIKSSLSRFLWTDYIYLKRPTYE